MGVTDLAVCACSPEAATRSLKSRRRFTPAMVGNSACHPRFLNETDACDTKTRLSASTTRPLESGCLFTPTMHENSARDAPNICKNLSFWVRNRLPRRPSGRADGAKKHSPQAARTASRIDNIRLEHVDKRLRLHTPQTQQNDPKRTRKPRLEI